MEKLYNISKTAEFLGVTRYTIYNWKKQGKINFVKVNGFNKVRESEIKKMIKED